MKTAEACTAIKEVMTAYNKHRAMWIKRFGSDNGFDSWFTRQTINDPSTKKLICN